MSGAAAKPEKNPTFASFHREMKHAFYTPAFNAFLTAVIKNPTWPLDLRVLAWLLLNSWGNWKPFVCRLNLKGGAPWVPATQTDCANDLTIANLAALPEKEKKRRAGAGKVDVRRVNEVVVQFERRGILALRKNVIVLNPDPKIVLAPFEEQTEADDAGDTSAWATFSRQVWPDLFPDQARELAELDAKVKPLVAMKMSVYRDWKRARNGTKNGTQAAAANGTGTAEPEVHGVAEPESAEIRNAADVTPSEIRNATDNLSGTPRIPDEELHIGTRASENLKSFSAGGSSESTTTTTLLGAEKEAQKEPSSSSSPTEPPAEWTEGLARVFHDAGKPVPIAKQSLAAYWLVFHRWQEFLRWLPASGEFRRMKHPGGLPTLIQMFEATHAVAAAAPSPPAQTPEEQEAMRAEVAEMERQLAEPWVDEDTARAEAFQRMLRKNRSD